MRLDKFLSESTDLSRSEARKVLKSGEITVNGMVINKGTHVIQEGVSVQW